MIITFNYGAFILYIKGVVNYFFIHVKFLDFDNGLNYKMSREAHR